MRSGRKLRLPPAHQLIKIYLFDAPKRGTAGPASASTNQDLSFQCARPENYGSRQRIIWFDLLFLMRLGMNLLAPSAHHLIKIYLFDAPGQKTTVPASAPPNQD
jgi:hypothetical protein